MDDLKQTLYAYKDVDNQLQEVNRQVAELRQKRKEYETRLASLLSRPEFTDIKKLEIRDDNSYVLIHRPDTWTKPWSLSKKELETTLGAYFGSTSAPTAAGCYEFICAAQKKTGKEFTFDRIVKTNKDA